MLFTTISDCQVAREMLLRVAREAIGEYVAEAQLPWKRITDNYRSANPLEPTVAPGVNAGSLEFTVDYIADYTQHTVRGIGCSRKSRRKLQMTMGGSSGHHRE